MIDFAQKLNKWSSEKIPFLFVIDFEMQKPLAWRFEDAARENVYFEISGFTNMTDVQVTSESVLEKFPMSYDSYKHLFDKVFTHFHRGDTYLTNLTIKTEIKLHQTLKELFGIAKAKYKLLFKDQFLVFSPETFIKVVGDKIFTYPMKGTADASIPDGDKLLLLDRKELAEHVTVVDLLRNDISLVASNVKVSRFRYLEKVKTNEKHLWQMSSEIVGDLDVNYQNKLGDLLVKLLPAGSVCGAPRAKTLEIIKEAEQVPRGFYTGVFGYFNGSELDSGVMIRFIEKEKDKYFYRSGGGITANSSAMNEYQEAINKIYVPIN